MSTDGSYKWMHKVKYAFHHPVSAILLMETDAQI